MFSIGEYVGIAGYSETPTVGIVLTYTANAASKYKNGDLYTVWWADGVITDCWETVLISRETAHAAIQISFEDLERYRTRIQQQ